MRASLAVEVAGIPAVSLVGSLFEQQARQVSAFLGVEDPPLAVYPGRIPIDDETQFRLHGRWHDRQPVGPLASLEVVERRELCDRAERGRREPTVWEYACSSDDVTTYLRPLVEVFGKSICGYWLFTGLAFGRWHPIVLVSPHLARLLHTNGWTKDDVRRYLYEESRIPARDVEAMVLTSTWTSHNK